ncbi:hypothetical protein RB597_006603 [Gaeumannomyces tritici]
MYPADIRVWFKIPSMVGLLRLPSTTTRPTKAIKMASKTPVLTDKAPKPLPGIYSQAIKANGFVFVSGAVPMDATTMQIIDGDIQAHTVRQYPKAVSHFAPQRAHSARVPSNEKLQHQCIKNLTAILEEAGSSIDKVVKVNVFLSNMDDFAAMNEIYCQYWGDVKPCRTCVAVKTLPLNVDVEIECIATY